MAHKAIKCSACGVDTAPHKGMCKKHYDAARYEAMPKREKKPLRSSYRFINDGNGSSILVHQVIVEKILGRPIPKGIEIHHVDGDGQNNTNDNLVVCPSAAYHKLLHVRTAALDACGNANWLRCIRCKQYDDPARMRLYVPRDQTSPRAEHPECNRRYRNEFRKSRSA